MKPFKRSWVKHFCLVVSLFSTSLFLLSACGSDGDGDDEGGGRTSSSLQVGVFTGSDGVQYRLSRVGYYYAFSYDDDGALSYLTCSGGGAYAVTNNPLTVYSQNYDDVDVVNYSDFSFNSAGYVTKCKYEQSYYAAENEYEVWTGSFSMSYNGSGQLTKLSCKMEGETCIYNEKSKSSASINYAFTYKNGNLIASSAVIKGNEYGQSYTDTAESTYTYGNQENPSGQYTVGVLDAFDFQDALSALAMVGYLGKASAYLPKSIVSVITETDDGGDPETIDDSFTYSVNSNNSLVTKENGVTYSYATLTKAIDEAEPADFVADKSVKRSHRHGAWRF